ncbi:MAG: flippase [Chloroflexi bacterium]|nr:flippase [Chloroflexota bacterium]
MNTIQRVFKNTAALFIAQGFTLASQMVIAILIANRMGDDEFGGYSAALAYMLFFLYGTSLGYTTVVIREVSRNKSLAGKYYGNVIAARLLLMGIGYIILVLIVHLLGDSLGLVPDTKFFIYFLALYAASILIGDIHRAIFRAFEKMEYETLTVIIREALRTGLGTIAIVVYEDLRLLVVAFLIPGFLDLLISMYLCRKNFTKPRLEIDWKFQWQTLKIAVPLGMLTVFGVINARADTVMLTAWEDREVVGWYNAAVMFSFGLKPLQLMFMNALLPLASVYYISSRDMLKILYEKAMKIMIIIGLPMAVGLTMLADRFILLLFGTEFEKADIALQILAWDIFLVYMGGPMAQILVAMNRQNQMAKMVAAGAALNVAVNFVLIPHYSYTGAAVATLISGVAIGAVYFYLVSKHLTLLPIHKLLIPPLIAGTAMAGFIHLCRDLNLIIIIVCSVVIYFAMLYVARGVSKDDIEMIKQLRQRPVSPQL